MKLQGLLLAAVLLAAGAATAQAQTRYTPPPATTLSSDLASPWILQLRNKPRPDGGLAVEIARPQMAARPQPAPRPRRRDGFHAITPVFAMPGFAAPAYRAPSTAPQAYNVQPAPSRRPVAYPVANPVAPPVMRPAMRPATSPATSNVQRASVQKPAAPSNDIDPKFEPQMVAYDGAHSPGTIVIDTSERFLYLVQDGGKARRYGIGVGKEGFEWSGVENISRKAEWPGWTPPKEMIAREAARGHYIPDHMEGGPKNPLGARALYLGDTLYRIHGTNQPWTIGKAVSSGCIRMRNEDVMDLYERVGVGTKVIVG